jgi:hypothetical protein
MYGELKVNMGPMMDVDLAYSCLIAPPDTTIGEAVPAVRRSAAADDTKDGGDQGIRRCCADEHTLRATGVLPRRSECATVIGCPFLPAMSNDAHGPWTCTEGS